jgi:predicted GNAT family acetyltransferase
MLEIRHKDDGKKGEFYIGEDGHHLAEMAYTWAGENMLIIDHTLVEDELRGQSV